jgi:DNA-directed RNA polymerase subunit RPC12/RpoP
MAEGIRYFCDNCNRNIETWSDGNPYYIDEGGKKKYAYHPDHDSLDKCIGNDSPYICLSCGEAFKVDSRTPITECPKCRVSNISAAFELSGLRCPYCKKGVFKRDPKFCLIS